MKNTRPLGAKTGRAYEYVKRRILDGTYGPGYRLVLENISREADMSQLPVREALRRLEAEGYVSYKHNSGARVAELDPAAYESTQHVIAVLEGAATAGAAPLLTPDALARAAVLNDEMRRRRELFDAEGFMELNAEFHELLCAPCPNEHLLAILESERSRMALIRKPTLATVMRHSAEFIEDHDLLLKIIAQDPRSPEIQMLSQAHKRRILDAVHSEVLAPHAAPPRQDVVASSQASA